MRRSPSRFSPSLPTGEDLLEVAWISDPSSLLDAVDDPFTGIALMAAGVLVAAIAAVVLLPLLGVALELAVPEATSLPGERAPAS
jgi:hypothetical protein